MTAETDWLGESAAEAEDLGVADSDDWLGEPSPSQELSLVPRHVSPIAVPEDEGERNSLVKQAWDRLDSRQQQFLMLLKANHFSVRAAARNGENAGGPARRTVMKWAETDPDYAFVLKVMKAMAANAVTDPDRLLLRAAEIADLALEPKPILYKGEPTGYYEHSLDTALRANEQLMKTQKMLSNDDTGPKVTQGPALVIQVVQRDGALIDVTPNGVVIDLPAPDGT